MTDPYFDDEDSVMDDTDDEAAGVLSMRPYGGALPDDVRNNILSRALPIALGDNQEMSSVMANLKQAEARLMASLDKKPGGINLPLLAAAAGIMAPTRTGGFGEALSNAGQAALKPLQQQQQDEQARDLAKAKLGYQFAQQGALLPMKRQQIGAQLLRTAAQAAPKAPTGQGRITTIIEPGKGPQRVLIRPDGSKEFLGRAPNSSSMAASPEGKVKMDYNAGVYGEPGTPEAIETMEAALRRLSKEAQNPADTIGTPDSADVYGVPVSEVDPLRGLDPKTRSSRILQIKKKADTDLGNMSTQEQTYRNTLMDLDRFEALNKETQANALERGVPLTQSITGLFNEDVKEMQAITARLARQNRQPGEGAVSDYDAQQFIKATVDYGKPYETNANMIKAMRARERMSIDRIQFMQDYYLANGHLEGADNMWRKYANSNPIFDPKQPGKLELNKSRLGYQDYFRAYNEQQRRKAAGADK